MKLLKIENGQGYYLENEESFSPINEITKEKLMMLVDIVFEKEAVELDEYDEQQIKNKAHQIVYKNIYEKLHSLRGRRQEFIDESKRQYWHQYKEYLDAEKSKCEN